MMLDTEQYLQMVYLAAVIDAIDELDYYHQDESGKMVPGGNPDLHQVWYKEDEVYAALEKLATMEPEGRTGGRVEPAAASAVTLYGHLGKIAEELHTLNRHIRLGHLKK